MTSPAHTEPSTRRRPVVLIVDDNVELAEDLAEVLELEGLEVDFVGGGRDALRRLAERSYDLIITDMRMPEVSGLDLIRQVKATQPAVPVVAMTAYSKEEKLTEARVRGALEVMEKPIDLGRLVELAGLVRSSRTAVLIVEDDDARRTALTELLVSAGGIMPFPAAGAADADALAGAVSVDVAIVGARLSDESGLALADRLLSRHPNLRVLLVTGHADEAPVHGDRTEVLLRPFAAQELIERVRALS